MTKDVICTLCNDNLYYNCTYLFKGNDYCYGCLLKVKSNFLENENVKIR